MQLAKPTEQEVHQLLDICSEAMENGSKYPGMSYEDGLRDGIDWVTEGGEPPLEID